MDYFVENFHEILGIEPGEKVEILTPQFKREYKLEIDWKPESVYEFNEVKKFPSELLLKMGVRKWSENKDTGEIIYIYPGEWYNLIPEGYPIVDINDEEELFNKEKTDDDIRFGCLAYGFKRIKD
jgi:hypothetical protein